MSHLEELHELYDWAEVDARSAARSVPRGRGGMGAAVLAAALWAVDDLVLGERRREPVVEEMDAPRPDPTQPVVVDLVWGRPSASRAFVIS